MGGHTAGILPFLHEGLLEWRVRALSAESGHADAIALPRRDSAILQCQWAMGGHPARILHSPEDGLRGRQVQLVHADPVATADQVFSSERAPVL
jgi:hypothetical protein